MTNLIRRKRNECMICKYISEEDLLPFPCCNDKYKVCKTCIINPLLTKCPQCNIPFTIKYETKQVKKLNRKNIITILRILVIITTHILGVSNLIRFPKCLSLTCRRLLILHLSLYGMYLMICGLMAMSVLSPFNDLKIHIRLTLHNNYCIISYFINAMYCILTTHYVNFIYNTTGFKWCDTFPIAILYTIGLAAVIEVCFIYKNNIISFIQVCGLYKNRISSFMHITEEIVNPHAILSERNPITR